MQVLSREFYAEGAACGDLNQDGHLDVVAGHVLFLGPDGRKQEFRPGKVFDPHAYSDTFFCWLHDFDGDGHTDVLQVGVPGQPAYWYRNPGPKKLKSSWSRFQALDSVDNESPAFADVNGDGRKDLLCQNRGRFGWAAFDPEQPQKPWVFHPISPDLGLHRFTHGLGLGDVDGDGRPDLLEKGAWWQQPASLAGDPPWKRHAFPFAPGRGGAQMFVFDVDGDGLADVLSGHDAHGYGLSWWRQVRDQDRIRFEERKILTAPEAGDGLKISQLHAMAVADVDGDRRPDLITGKRWWAHGPKGDVDPGGTPLLLALCLRPGKPAAFEIKTLHRDSGVGTQVQAGDFDRDGRVEIAVANKRGVFLWRSQPASNPENQ